MRGERKIRRLLGRLACWLLFLKLPILVYLVCQKKKIIWKLSKKIGATGKKCPVFSPPLRCAVAMVALLGQESFPGPEK